MQRAALRSIYGSSQPKTKHVAVVAPVLDTDEENPSRSDDDDVDLKLGSKRSGSNNNNWSTISNVSRLPEAEEGEEAAGIVLQKKSAQYEIPHLSALTGGIFSNQSQELHELYQQQQQHGDSPPSGAAQKHTVLGQKQKWRKSRAQRSRCLGQTISPVEDAFEVQGDELGEEEDLENPSPPSSPRQSSSPYLSVNERLDTQRSYSSQGPPPLPSLSSGRLSSREGSQLSSRYDSSRSTGRSESSSSTGTNGDEKQRFVVTRQKKSKYAARIHLPGQQNPLYLGRYKNEEAAFAACESAYSVITTPRK